MDEYGDEFWGPMSDLELLGHVEAWEAEEEKRKLERIAERGKQLGVYDNIYV